MASRSNLLLHRPAGGRDAPLAMAHDAAMTSHSLGVDEHGTGVWNVIPLVRPPATHRIAQPAGDHRAAHVLFRHLTDVGGERPVAVAPQPYGDPGTELSAEMSATQL